MNQTVASADDLHGGSRYERVRARVHAVMSGADLTNPLTRVVGMGLATLIILNVIAAALQTVASLHAVWYREFEVFEWFSVAVFTAEYVVRLWACTADPRFRARVLGRVRCALTPIMLIDFIAFAPSYLVHFITLDLRMLRLIRLVRLLRVLKIARYSESLQLLGRVVRARAGELLVTLIGATVLLVIASTVMYYVENEAQPAQFSSIPAAMWWAVETLTTIGYGDILPVTVPGKIINAFIALLGIGLFALPAGILGSGFVEEIQHKWRTGLRCPHCGRSLDETSSLGTESGHDDSLGGPRRSG